MLALCVQVLGLETRLRLRTWPKSERVYCEAPATRRLGPSSTALDAVTGKILEWVSGSEEVAIGLEWLLHV